MACAHPRGLFAGTHLTGGRKAGTGVDREVAPVKQFAAKDAGRESRTTVGGAEEESKRKENENENDRVEEGVGGVVGAAWMDDGPSHLLANADREGGKERC